MKKTIIRKIIYVFACLFLLCNFFSFAKGMPTEQNAFCYDDIPSITINVPNGIQMEIKSEKSASSAMSNTVVKAVQMKTYSNFRYLGIIKILERELNK